MKNASVTTHRCFVTLSPCFFCFLCSVIIISPDHYQANSPLTVMERRVGLPHSFGERFLTAAKEEGMGQGKQDKRPNKVHLNLETAGPFSPCPYKELLVNPGRLSSSLYWAQITPYRMGNITVGAWKHTHTHSCAQTQRTMLFYETEDGELGGVFFLSWHKRASLVEHTKIGAV